MYPYPLLSNSCIISPIFWDVSACTPAVIVYSVPQFRDIDSRDQDRAGVTHISPRNRCYIPSRNDTLRTTRCSCIREVIWAMRWELLRIYHPRTHSRMSLFLLSLWPSLIWFDYSVGVPQSWWIIRQARPPKWKWKLVRASPSTGVYMKRSGKVEG